QSPGTALLPCWLPRPRPRTPGPCLRFLPAARPGAPRGAPFQGGLRPAVLLAGKGAAVAEFSELLELLLDVSRHHALRLAWRRRTARRGVVNRAGPWTLVSPIPRTRVTTGRPAPRCRTWTAR